MKKFFRYLFNIISNSKCFCEILNIVDSSDELDDYISKKGTKL